MLTKSLQPHALDRHRADVCIVMEAMVRKHDKFGWDQMNAGMRQMVREDWLAALADFPVEEVRAACRQHTIDAPDRVPNEGHIRAQIMKARSRIVAAMPRQTAEEPERQRVTKERAAKIMAEAHMAGVKRMGE